MADNTPGAPRRDNPYRIREAAVRSASPLILLAFVLARDARAIPSPDVMISLFASAAQVLGVATVILGRWFFVRRGQGGARAKGGRSYATAFGVTAALFAASLAGWGLYYLHVQDTRAARLQLNLVRSSTENGKLVGDVNLKTLTFSEQKKREDGLDTEELAQGIADGSITEPLFDIRETEEVEMGTIAGVQHMRYPDLLAHPEQYLPDGAAVILLCFNGNRSSETADALRAKGYRPRFMIGGYEKWCAEERPLELKPGVVRKDLREIPDYPNKDVLLETDEVTRLVQEENALFLDVRYPGEFELQGHLPKAHLLPMRSMTSPDLEKALAEVPKRPIIGVCYDKRGSFYALIVGLRLSRLGYDWRGRYTVPEEYYVPSKDKAHVLAWQEAHEGKSLLAAVAEPLGTALDRLEEASGSLALGILLLVLALRAALIPFTWKAERDRLEQARLEPEIAELKARYGDDRAGAARATVRLLSAHRVRPMLNLLGTSAQLVLLLAFFSVISRKSAESQGEGFGWIPELSATDPLKILPAAIALLALAQLALSARRATLAKLALWCALCTGLLFLVLPLSAGVTLYLAANLLIMVLHSLAVRAWFERSHRPRTVPAPELGDAPVAPLAVSARVDGAGKKAARLGALIEAGLDVPAGFVVRDGAVRRFLERGAWSPADRGAILAAHARLGAARVAVRSSGVNEDGEEASFAGVYESVLDVSADGLFDALAHVARSQTSDRARAYAGGGQSTQRPERLGIVVQAMVPAEFAGVLFTEHPGESGSMLVECVRGLGEELVSGRAQPTSHRFGRLSERPLDEHAAPIDFAPLVALGRRVEQLFGAPQDVEWAYANGRFHLLQARDITRLSRRGVDAKSLREAERARLLAVLASDASHAPDEVALEQNELSELLPQPTPYSLALMQSLWAHGGSTDLACRELGVPYDVHPDSPPLFETAFGRLYIRRSEERRRLAKSPSSLAAFRLSRDAEGLETRLREGFLPEFRRRSRLDLAADLGRLSFAELVDLHRERRERFVREIYVEAEVINVAADLLFKSARRALERRGLDPAEHLSHAPRTVVDEGLELLAEVAREERPVEDFLSAHGHRSPLDYELSAPRFDEDPALVAEQAARAAASPHRPRGEAPPLPRARILGLSVDRARRFAALKEEAKHHALRELAFLRRILVELGRRTGLGDSIFQLAPEEVDRLQRADFPLAEVRALATARAERAAALSELELSSRLSLADLEALDVERGQKFVARAATGRLRGTRVSGSGGVCGRARVLRAAGEIDTLQPGEILVARFTDPAWTPVFGRCGGIVTEVGGWLSHAAILAREQGITAIVGASGALQTLRTGDLIRLGEDGSVELFSDRRLERRVDRRVAVSVRRPDRVAELQGELDELSRFGARLSLAEGSLEVGQRCRVRAREGELEREALVVRNGVPGLYGLSFEEELAIDGLS